MFNLLTYLFGKYFFISIFIFVFVSLFSLLHAPLGLFFFFKKNLNFHPKTVSPPPPTLSNDTEMQKRNVKRKYRNKYVYVNIYGEMQSKQYIPKYQKMQIH